MGKIKHHNGKEYDDDVIIKINGERNSGTGFLRTLIIKNFPSHFWSEMEQNGNVVTGWKHGEPTTEYKDMFPNTKIINIFVVREIESWLVSFFKNPYHVIRKPNFLSFISEQQHINRNHNFIKHVDSRNNKPVNYLDEGRTIFEIRNYKLQKYKEFFENEDYVVIVPLDYLQNNTLEFLEKLSDKYNLKLIDEPIVEFVHEKTKNNKEKNRSYGINIGDVEKKIIEVNSNPELETFFNELKFN